MSVSKKPVCTRWTAVNKMAADWIKRMEGLVERWKKQAETADKVQSGRGKFWVFSLFCHLFLASTGLLIIVQKLVKMASHYE